MVFVLGFLPWIAYFVIGSIGQTSATTLLIAAAVGFVLQLIMFVTSLRSGVISSLDIGTLIFFPLMAVLTFVLPLNVIVQWSAFISRTAT